MGLLTVSDLVAGCSGAEQILNGLDFTCDAAEIVCIVGPNGAGKSALPKSIAGLLHPSSGSILFNDRPVDRPSPPALARLGIAYVPQELNIFSTMTVRRYDHRLLASLIHLSAEVERIYTSHPAEYPIGGREQKSGTCWARKVLDSGDLSICHAPADIIETFADHTPILTMGIGGMVNVPVRFGGHCIATLNISTEGDRFSEDDAPELSLLAALALPLVLSEVSRRI